MKKCDMLNDKRIKACILRYDNGAYSRMQFLPAVSHPIGTMRAHTEALWLTADSSSSSDKDKTYETSPATTSESSESPVTAAAMLMFALKRKYKNSDQQSPIVARCLLRCTVEMLCCMNQWPISLQSSSVWRPIILPPFAVCPSVRLSLTSRQVGTLRKRWEIGLQLLWGVDRK